MKVHGDPNTYNYHGCRCDECKEGYRLYQLSRTKARKLAGLDDNDERHGTYSGYANYGCRCPACREANRIHAINYRLRTGKITEAKAEELIYGA